MNINLSTWSLLGSLTPVASKEPVEHLSVWVFAFSVRSEAEEDGDLGTEVSDDEEAVDEILSEIEVWLSFGGFSVKGLVKGFDDATVLVDGLLSVSEVASTADEFE